MSNPLFNQFNQNIPMSMVQQFNQFRQQMQGVNPQNMVMDMLQSGKINQQQLNQAQQMAQKMQYLLRQ
jgi:ribosomal protein L16/L10AE